MNPQGKKALERFRKFIDRSLAKNLYEFNLHKPHLPLMIPSYSSDEILDVVETLLSTNVTMGEKVFKFEEKFAAYIGCKEGVMVNSGSSANLLAVSTLTNPLLGRRRLHNGFEAIMPAVTWSTTMFPISNCNGVPVLCDVNPESFNLMPEAIRGATTRKSQLIVPVHLLGNPCDVTSIRNNLDEKSHVRILEDSCEAHGAEINGRKVGSIGDMGTFSFYFSHHISTIEGGIMVTNNEELAENARMLRAHGWIRELRSKNRYASEHASIDPRFLFVNLGYNLRPTEVQGAFGLRQLDKLESFIAIRRANARFISKRLKRYERYIVVQTERPGTRHVWFGYPITVRDEAGFSRNDLIHFLEKKGVQTRPIMGGNLAEQPATALIRHKVSGRLENSRRIMRKSFFFGNHQGLNREALDYIVSCFEEFFANPR